jgi:hypothetical protein
VLELRSNDSVRFEAEAIPIEGKRGLQIINAQGNKCDSGFHCTSPRRGFISAPGFEFFESFQIAPHAAIICASARPLVGRNDEEAEFFGSFLALYVLGAAAPDAVSVFYVAQLDLGFVAIHGPIGCR